MTASGPNRAESIRQRLRNRLRERGEDVQFGLQRYALERFLYRLGQSRHRERFVLKGATLFPLWGTSVYRPTRDLDFTGYGSPDQSDVLAALREVCDEPSPLDEINFDVATLAAEPIRDESEYQGLRIRLRARLGGSRIPMQIDIGFGNAIEPPPQEIVYPTLLDDVAPRIRAYPPEAVIAEKFHAMTVIGERTSRLRDFYDLFVLGSAFSFDGERLGTAVAATFQRRRTPFGPERPATLAPRFYADPARAEQWRTYLSRNSLPGAPADFTAVGELLGAFLGPMWDSLAAGQAHRLTWRARGLWGEERPPIGSEPAVLGPSTAVIRSQVPPRRKRIARDANARRRAAHRRFRRYPVYKDSGVEWLGEIPEHWEVKRLKFLTALNPSASELRPIASDTEVSFVPMEAVGEYGGLDLSRIKPLADVSAGYTYFRNSDVVVAKITPCFENGKGALASDLVNGIAFGTTELHVLRAKPIVDGRFVLYLTLSDAFRRLGEAEMYGAGGQKRVPEAFVENLKHPVPPLAEQRAVAAFLDRETGRIDALGAKKGRLIELLQEKRTALITRAVTKGLDPNVPMKDAGVEALGEIPAHWDVKRVRHAASRIGSGKTPSGGAEVYVREGVMLLRSQNIHFAGLHLDDVAFIDPLTDAEMAGSRVQEDDVLLNITGASLGRCCVARLDGKAANVNQHVCVIRPNRSQFEPAFLAVAIASQSGQDQIFNTENGISRDALNFNQIGDLSLGRPPIEEQRAIATFLDRKTARIDALAAKVREAIKRLKELRTALISAAVTGKIDVREEVA